MTKTFCCADCPQLRAKRCRAWQVKVKDPQNSYCESGAYFIQQAAQKGAKRANN